MKNFLWGLLLAMTANTAIPSGQAGEKPWRELPLITEGKVDAKWGHTGWGTFTAEDGALRTDCDARGMGLLVYTAETFGNCQLRVVFRSRDAKSNGGVYIRMDKGILAQIGKKPDAVERDAKGKLLPGMLAKIEAAAEGEVGPWYAVHHGFEVQICDAGDPLHRTGAIYGLAKSSAPTNAPPDPWRTMIITLRASTIDVEIDSRAVACFDARKAAYKKPRKWTEPKLDLQRPETGYIGLQNHDPGDVVYYKSVSVRALK